MKFLLVLIISTYSASATAQELNREEIRKQVRSIQSIPLKYQGKEGVWFPKKDAELLLNLVSSKLKLSLDIIDSQETQVSALQTAVDAYKLSANSYEDLSEFNKGMFDIVMESMSKIKPVEVVWYKSSTATFIYGLLLGGAIIFGTTYLSVEALNKQ